MTRKSTDPSAAFSLPPHLRESLSRLRALEAGFGAGPGMVAGKVQDFRPGVPLDEALTWLGGYRDVLARGHVLLEDGTLLFFARSGEVEVRRGGGPPRPGLVVRTPDDDEAEAHRADEDDEEVEDDDDEEERTPPAPSMTLTEAFHASPSAMTVDGLRVRPLGRFLEGHEGELASMLSDARSAWETSYDLFDRFTEDLPEVLVDRRGRLLPGVRKTIGRYAREAAGAFGPAGFCGDASVWASWLMTEHAALSELLALGSPPTSTEPSRRRRTP